MRIAAGNPTLFVPKDETKIKWLTSAAVAAPSEKGFKFQHAELREDTVVVRILRKLTYQMRSLEPNI